MFLDLFKCMSTMYVMYVCAPYACVIPEKVRRRQEILKPELWMVDAIYVELSSKLGHRHRGEFSWAC